MDFFVVHGYRLIKPFLRVKIVPFSVGVTLIGSGLAIIYYLRKDDVDDECVSDVPVRPCKRKRTFTEIQIDKDRIGHLIGKGGINIKEFQDKSATRITFKDEVPTDNFRVCVIRGLPSNVQKAEFMIKDFLAKHKMETLEFFIPQNTCGLIIGKGGSTIRLLQKESGAKILVDSSDFEVKGQKVTIKGTSEEINKAKNMIKSKIEEQFSPSEFSGIQRRPNSSDIFESFESSNVETLDSGSEVMQVHVSSMRNPSSFYIQIADERRCKLKKMEEEMLTFYESAENQQLHKLESAGVGRLVVAKYSDGKWYRGTVVKIKSSSDLLKVFYVDYGDIEWKNLSSVLALNPKFQDLKHQAILCSLDGIRKIEESWPEEATDLFESLTYDPECNKKLMARVEGFSASNNNVYIPSVSLRSLEEEGNLSVTEELIAKGFGEAITSSIPNLVPGGDEDWS
ncbi:tudor and KH domain-containing protein homolog [Cloeon dipterum]|uniref:tudor and KH domain-containing protein homolog n=1 Tax=Cloeon dipterum TaxID=197152 RepID=UPI00321F7019